MSEFWVALFFFQKAKSVGIVVTMLSIINEVEGRKRPHNVIRYLFTIPDTLDK